ncbi:fused MFS/spermidine synthase [Fimbriiglobus ruber]|uniref:Membrane protein/conserved domain protein n=1 Tax=Fimbriiglobus ruber TaxID=1908690 RepID=A0A225DHS3_9BACT|nr:fused MFS/spermidine synthase [Fimbriiglobus ruber]OWK35915.1 membrane protein/conserved domain protein [Fimbriiglobus ruber]
MLPVLFAATLFASAALLFVVQPMAGKVLLPQAGGTPAVWNTCLVFFQAVLLLGYLYAHALTTVLSARRQIVAHLGVIALGLAVAVGVRPDPDWIPDDGEFPFAGLVAFLAALVGGPFLVLSASAPVFQRWFAQTGHRSAHDPYFLYAASNAGSFIGLLGYPFLVEPNLPLDHQESWWRTGYAVFFGLAAACGTVVWLRSRRSDELQASTQPDGPKTPAPSRGQLLKWVGLAALPSSLLMGATTHLTTDVAPVPLFWVVPLALYLLSFVIVFARWPDSARRVVGRATPMLLVFLVVALLTGATEPLALVVGVHLVAFFAAALLCHGELAHDRPARDHLTAFYLAMSAGGVLGGLFNALVAPLLFTRLGLVEYPLAIVAVAFVRPRFGPPEADKRFAMRDVAIVAAFAALTVALVLGVSRFVPAAGDGPDAMIARLVRGGLMFGIPAAVAFALVRKAWRFAACLGVLLLAGTLDTGRHGTTELVERTFFGTLRVTRSADGKLVRLVHGTTQHGQEWADETGPPRPLMYYHRSGPVGRLFAAFDKRPPDQKRRVAVVGLGCGAMAAYAEPGQEWTFYEIDPGVVRIARDPRYFRFLSECAVEPRIVLGDARRQLVREPDGQFDLIVLDAFSSDAIPVHLLTREAYALYVRKLAPHGVLAFHLSNRYLDLPPMVARLGADHDPPFSTHEDRDKPFERDREDGAFDSDWVVAARDPADLGPMRSGARWQTVRPTAAPVWRDDFSNLLTVWKRGEE